MQAMASGVNILVNDHSNDSTLGCDQDVDEAMNDSIDDQRSMIIPNSKRNCSPPGYSDLTRISFMANGANETSPMVATNNHSESALSIPFVRSVSTYGRHRSASGTSNPAFSAAD